MTRRAYRITGYVQGVGFRWWTRMVASALDLQGTVRNARDGSVEVEAQGPAEALERFEQQLREGPSSAHVRELEIREPGEGSLPAGFEIIH